MASDITVSPDAIRMLASDHAVMVRAALAMNPAVPLPLVRHMVQDPDDRVRALLARRLASLLPSLSAPELGQLQDQVVQSLHHLVADEAVRVRIAIAEVVKDMPQAPHDLVLKLARDIAVPVAEPVIRLSPLLTDDDLLGLLATLPAAITATAVARRPDLSERVTSAIAACDDVPAIEALLLNRSSAISEAALDDLIARSAGHIGWQAPLVRRPRLPATAARALAEIICIELLAELAKRENLPAGLAMELSTRLKVRLSHTVQTEASAKPGPQDALRIAHALDNEGILTEDALISAVQRGEVALCTAMIAVAADVALEAVERACRLRSAKGLVSLVWRAGFTMRVAGPLQSLLAQLPPDASLRPIGADKFPLTTAEMGWQVSFLCQAGQHSR
jgi:uncharacterized protein (DUF2336 family)